MKIWDSVGVKDNLYMGYCLYHQGYSVQFGVIRYTLQNVLS